MTAQRVRNSLGSHTPIRRLLFSPLDAILGVAPGGMRLLLALIVLAAPLLLEGVPPGLAILQEIALTITLALWLSMRLAAPVVAPLGLEKIVYPVLAAAFLLLLQAVLLPPSWASWLSPSSAAVIEDTLPLIGSSSGLRGWYVSLAPGASLHGVVRYLLLLGFFLIVRDRFRGQNARHWLLHILMVALLVQVVIGFLHSGFGAEAIYFMSAEHTGDKHFFGSFISANRNAAYLNLLWPVFLGVGINARFAEALSPKFASRSRFPRMAVSADLLPWWAYMGVAALGFVGAIACRSRMAWGVILFLLLTLLSLFVARSGRSKTAAAVWLLAMAGVGTLVKFMFEPLMAISSDLAHKNEAILRPTLWEAAFQAIREHPFLGLGLETFRQGFGRYNPIRGYYAVIHSESLYLDILFEGGILVFLLMMAAVVAVFLAVVRSRFWLRREDQGLILGLITGLLGFALQSLVEHTTRGYGNPITVLALMGMLVAAIRSPGAAEHEPSLQWGVTPARAYFPWLIVPVLAGLTTSFGLGQVLEERSRRAYAAGDLASLRPVLEKVARLSPFHAGPERMLGLLDFLDAQGALERSFEQRTEDAMATLASVPALLSSSETHLWRALQRDPAEGYAQRALSAVAQLRGRKAEAIAYASDACRVQVRDHRHRSQLARLLEWAGEREPALSAYKEALRLAPDDAIESLVAAVFRVAHQRLEVATPYIPSDASPRVYLEVAEYLEERDRWEDARPWYLQTIERAAPVPDLSTRAGWKAILHRDLELAERAAVDLIRRFPDDDDGYSIRAEERFLQGEVGESLAMWEAAAVRNPPGIQERLSGARVYSRAGQHERALGVLTELEGRYPHQPAVQIERAKALIAVKRFSDAGDALRRAIAMEPLSEEPQYLLWNLHRTLGGVELLADAEQELERCASLPKAPRCTMERGRAALQKGDLKEAQKWLEVSGEQEPASAEVWRLLAEVRFRCGETDKAREAMSKARSLAPGRVEWLRDWHRWMEGGLPPVSSTGSTSDGLEVLQGDPATEGVKGNSVGESIQGSE